LQSTLILSSRPSYAGPASSRAAAATARAAGMCWRADNTRAKRAQEGGWQPPEAFKAARQLVSAAGSWRPSACITIGIQRWDGVKATFFFGQMAARPRSLQPGTLLKAGRCQTICLDGPKATRPWPRKPGSLSKASAWVGRCQQDQAKRALSFCLHCQCGITFMCYASPKRAAHKRSRGCASWASGGSE